MKQQETLEEVAKRIYPINNTGTMFMAARNEVNNSLKQEGFIEGAKWQQEQDKKMYSKMQVYQIIELIRLTGESPEFIMEQLNKPIHKNQNLNKNNL